MEYHPELERTLGEPIPRCNIVGVLILATLLVVAPLAIALWVYA